MLRLRLSQTIVIEGRDIWGRASALTISPLSDETDYRWIWQAGSRNVVITPLLFTLDRLGRTVMLIHEGRALKEFEHIAFLHALGLRGVRLRLEGSCWLPCMCQQELWKLARLLLRQQRPLKQYRPAYARLVSKKGLSRSITYNPSFLDRLRVSVVVEYDGADAHQNFDYMADYDERQLAAILAARTLGRPSALQPLAHAASYLKVWRDQTPITATRGGFLFA